MTHDRCESDSPPARPASCTSATRAPRCSTGCWRAAAAARSSCASKTPTPSARRASRKRRSCATCAGSGSTGTRGRTSAARTGRTASPSGCTSIESYAKELLDAGPAYSLLLLAASSSRRSAQAALAAGRPARYAGRCRGCRREQAQARIAAGERPAIRFRVPEDREVVFDDVVRGEVRFHTDVIGDPVIVRADGTPAYNFAVVIDDALMEMTHVIRGEDHISNTPRQILLYEALGFTPPAFAHLALVMGPDHSPLSKRHGATSVAEFRAKGYLPEALVNYLALIGWSPGRTTTSCCRSTSSRGGSRSSDVGHSAGVFDEEKLAWVNRHYLKMADPARLAELSVPYLRRAPAWR